MPPEPAIAESTDWGVSLNGEGPKSTEYVPLTELGNAARLVAAQGTSMRFCHPWARWLVWDGRRWQLDETGEATRRAKGTVQGLLAEAAATADDESRKRLAAHALRSQSDRAIRAMLSLAQSELGIPILPDQLDVDYGLFNVSNGTVHLEVAEVLPHQRADLITKLARVAYDPEAEAPLWQAFLKTVVPSSEIREFLARLVGSSLAGGGNEQRLPIFFGVGANGKSTLQKVWLELLGDYGQTAPAQTFLAERRDSIPNDVARLRGARFVVASEIGEGRRLNEELVKRMTGGDRLVARYMRGEFFEFDARFLPLLVTNHRPEIRGTDEAIWRRICLVPFTVTIPPEERDPQMAERLLKELPGILNWAMDGCLEWKARGLDPPPAVLAATSAYRSDMDVVGGFLTELCIEDDNASVKSSELFNRYGYWASSVGEEALTQKAFALRLQERGFRQKRTNEARWWIGLALRAEKSDA